MGGDVTALRTRPMVTTTRAAQLVMANPSRVISIYHVLRRMLFHGVNE
jgi:hypothetical protein